MHQRRSYGSSYSSSQFEGRPVIEGRPVGVEAAWCLLRSLIADEKVKARGTAIDHHLHGTQLIPRERLPGNLPPDAVEHLVLSKDRPVGRRGLRRTAICFLTARDATGSKLRFMGRACRERSGRPPVHRGGGKRSRRNSIRSLPRSKRKWLAAHQPTISCI